MEKNGKSIPSGPLGKKLRILKIVTYTTVIVFGIAALALAIVYALTRRTGNNSMILLVLLIVSQVLCIGCLATGYLLDRKWSGSKKTGGK